MLNSSISNRYNEINMPEVFSMLWASKIFIIISCIIGIFFGISHISNTDKLFTSQAVFKMDKEEEQKSGIPNFSSLMLPRNSLAPGLPVEMIKGRVFIEALDMKVDFKSDPFFNKNNIPGLTPSWKNYIKKFIGFDDLESNPEEKMWQGIVKVYSSNVGLDVTDNGSIVINVTHKKSLRAAEIVNAIMDKVLADSIAKKNDTQDKRLVYLSEKLADALDELEVSHSKFNSFALKNSLIPKAIDRDNLIKINGASDTMMASFGRISSKIDVQRDQIKRSKLLYDAASKLVSLIQNNTVTTDDYFDLQKKFPIVDQVEFRRILGQNENIGTWIWPDENSVISVKDTLSKRIENLQKEINITQLEGDRIQEAHEVLIGLGREVKVAEATYTVLIEQVKAKSVSAGYKTDNSEVYSYGAPAMIPSKPRRTLILALSAVLGIFAGSGIAISICILRGVYFAKNNLITSVNARFSACAKTIYYLRNRSLDDIDKLLRTKRIMTIQDLAIEINKNDGAPIVISSSKSKLKSIDVAQGLGIYLQSNTIKVAAINFSEKSKDFIFKGEKTDKEPFEIIEKFGKMSILRPSNHLSSLDFLSKPHFTKDLHFLKENFDIILLCADDAVALSLLRSLKDQKLHHITLAKTKRTSSNKLLQMNALLPIQGLIYD